MGRRARMDPLLLTRIEQYSHNNSISDIDTTVEFLRRCYREYQRKQIAPFTKAVLQSVSILKARMRDQEVYSEEDPTELREEQHLKRRGFRIEEPEEDSDAEEIMNPSFNLLNSSLIQTYGSKPALVLQTPAPDSRLHGHPEEELKSSDPEKKKKKRERVSDKVENKKSKKKAKLSAQIQPANLGFKDFGGLGKTLEEVVEYIYPVLQPEVFDALGIGPVGGLLLHGPPGCGKTMLAEAIANELSVPFLKISAPEIITGTSGESEQKLRSLFSEASGVAPSVIFIDEVDSISSKRESAHREMERRIVTQLMTCMDDLGREKNSKRVLVIGATNRPEALDQAFRRRFEREVCLGVPDENARFEILQVLATNLKLEGEFDFKTIARRTPGFVGADLKTLTKEAGFSAVKRIVESRKTTPAGETEWWKLPWTPEALEKISITMQDFEVAMIKVQPSTKREGFTEIPSVTWEDVGSLDSVREELELFICGRMKFPVDYEALGMSDRGFLLYGPPGCGKTLLAKAVANAAGANFIYIKAAELLNKFVGESERAIRQLFSRARACSPCLIFFDEVDALAPVRGSDASHQTSDRVVNQLLVEMDGLEQRKSIFVIAASNRPSMIDPALLRPGRIGKLIYVPLPDEQGRESILKTLLRRLPLSPDVEISKIARSEACKNFSGADLQGLVQEACGAALRERLPLWQKPGGIPPGENVLLTAKHFQDAVNLTKPSVSKEFVQLEPSGHRHRTHSTRVGVHSSVL